MLFLIEERSLRAPLARRPPHTWLAGSLVEVREVAAQLAEGDPGLFAGLERVGAEMEGVLAGESVELRYAPAA